MTAANTLKIALAQLNPTVGDLGGNAALARKARVDAAARVIRELAAGGATYVTLGLVALSENAGADLQRNPLWIRTLMGWARAHGRYSRALRRALVESPRHAL